MTLQDGNSRRRVELGREKKKALIYKYIWKHTYTLLCNMKIINAYYEWHMHTATHDAGRFLMRRRSYCDLRGNSDESNDLKKSTAGAHSSTSSTVSSPPFCKPCMVVETQESAIQKRAPANTRLIIPLHTHATTRPGHALRLVEKKAAQIHWYIRKQNYAKWNKSPNHICCYCIAHWSCESYMHTHTMKSTEMPVCPICVFSFRIHIFTFIYICIFMYICVSLLVHIHVLCMNACMYVCMSVCIYTYMCTCICLFLSLCAHTSMYVLKYVCMYVMHACMYVCM